MAGWHVGIVVLAPADLAGELRGLSRALGAVEPARIDPHLTLVPPLRLSHADLGSALARLRRAGARSRPFTVDVGPVSTFSPVTPTVHLAVHDNAGQLRRLHEALFAPPLWRDTHPFRPHVTLVPEAPLHRIRAAVVALGAYRARLTVDRLTLLHERKVRGQRLWRPLADVDLDGVRTVGRGPLELELATGAALDPEARGALPGCPLDGFDLVVTARREGVVVGAAWGSVSGEASMVVRSDVRGQGIGRHLAREWEFRAAQGRARDALSW